MKWDEVEISDIDSHYRKKIISATIYIKTQEQSLNIMDDTELLNHIRPVQKPLKIVKSKKNLEQDGTYWKRKKIQQK